MNKNKKDLIGAIAQDTGYYKYEVEAIVNSLFEKIADTISNGDRVAIRGFGTFETKMFKSHAAVHPVTKERIVVPSHKNVSFSPGDDLKRRVRETE